MSNETKFNRDAEAEATKAWLQKDSLEQATAVGVSGPPQLRRWERSQFLGQFPEQVLWAITAEVLSLRPIAKELKAALADARCSHIFIKATEIEHARYLLQVSKQQGLPLTIVHSPEFRNDVAAVITTTEPHHPEAVFVKPRG